MERIAKSNFTIAEKGKKRIEVKAGDKCEISEAYLKANPHLEECLEPMGGAAKAQEEAPSKPAKPAKDEDKKFEKKKPTTRGRKSSPKRKI